MAKTILIIGTLDTKSLEFAYIRDLIQARGHKTLVLDVGVAGTPGFAADINAEEVSTAGGVALDELRKKADLHWMLCPKGRVLSLPDLMRKRK